MSKNMDAQVVQGFGEEWGAYDNKQLSQNELNDIFDEYFHRFPWTSLPSSAVGADIGCGSGRWAKIVANKVDKLICIDASSQALDVAKTNLKNLSQVEFIQASVDEIPLKPGSLDFLYSLGVLHHVPRTADAIKDCAKLLKPGAPFLLYLYYAFDQRPLWFKLIWKTSEIFRARISKMPFKIRHLVCNVIAALVYYPLAKISKYTEKLGFDVDVLPLSSYRSKAFYVMKNDALDRFGTQLEQRFTREQISSMLTEAGCEKITFNEKSPYWVALSYKK